MSAMQGTVMIIRPYQLPETQQHTHVPELEFFQHAVDGYIEEVPHFKTIGLSGELHNCVVFCNEDGKRKGLAYNQLATELWSDAIRRRGGMSAFPLICSAPSSSSSATMHSCASCARGPMTRPPKGATTMAKTTAEAMADKARESIKAAAEKVTSKRRPMKRVPREATEAMIAAMLAEAAKPTITIHDEPAILRIWRAGFDTAPGDQAEQTDEA